MSYAAEYKQSIDSPEVFWAKQAAELDWFTSPSTILHQDSAGLDRWFADGVLNTCYLALDYHVRNGRGGQHALLYDSPVTAQKKSFTYAELLKQVSLCAGMLKGLGVTKGDRVVIYMPMIPEAVISMLACARLGAIHSVVFGGFAPRELSVRLDDALPKVLLTASCGIEVSRLIEYKPLVDASIELAVHKPEAVVVVQREQANASLDSGIDHDWRELMASAQETSCVPVMGTDPLYILYTSGTTGKPKGVVRENGGHAVAMKYSMKAIYDMNPGDVFWAASDVGWVVGHSYIVYGPLIHGCTSVLYEGKPVLTPNAGAFWRVVADYGVKAIFSAPTAFRAIRKEDSDGELLKNYDVRSLTTVFAAGERLDPATYDWLKTVTQKPVIDHWWQTETGWAISANLIGVQALETKAGSSTKPVPGFDVRILDDEGNELPRSKQGLISIQLPLPPGCLTSIWGDPDRFRDAYLSDIEGYYATGDGGYLDEDGYLFVMGRVDDVINVAGHRLSTGEIEEVVGKHPGVAECAVIGRRDSLKGQLPVGLMVLKDVSAFEKDVIASDVVALVRNEIGAVASFKEVLIVQKLPKTRSGKILRQTLRKIIDGEEFSVPSTIEDASVIDELKKQFEAEMAPA